MLFITMLVNLICNFTQIIRVDLLGVNPRGRLLQPGREVLFIVPCQLLEMQDTCQFFIEKSSYLDLELFTGKMSTTKSASHQLKRFFRLELKMPLMGFCSYPFMQFYEKMEKHQFFMDPPDWQYGFSEHVWCECSEIMSKYFLKLVIPKVFVFNLLNY